MINFKEIHKTDSIFILLSEETFQYPKENGLPGFNYKLAIMADGEPEDDMVSVRLQAAICPQCWNQTAFTEDLLVPNGCEDIPPEEIHEIAAYCLILKNGPLFSFEDMEVENGGGKWMSIPSIAKAVEDLKKKASCIGEDDFSIMLSECTSIGGCIKERALNRILTGIN